MRFTFLYVLVLTIAAVAALGYLLQSRKAGPVDPTQALTLYCDSSARFPIARLVEFYREQRDVEIVIVYEGATELAKDLLRRRSGDVFVSTDVRLLEELQSRQPPLVAEIYPIATVRPVIVVQSGNPRDIESLGDLLHPGVKLVLADPHDSALGRVIRDALDEKDWRTLWDRRLVGRPTSSEVANDVKLGVAEVGIIWESTLREFPSLETVPSDELAQLQGEVAVGVLTCSKHPRRAEQLARFLASPASQKLFGQMGFSPTADATADGAGSGTADSR